MPEFHAEAQQATVSEGLAQGPYAAARAGVEPITPRTKGIDSTKAPPHPTIKAKTMLQEFKSSSKHTILMLQFISDHFLRSLSCDRAPHKCLNTLLNLNEAIEAESAHISKRNCSTPL